jgi:hypothetical protein
MPAVTLRSLSADMAVKLNQLETATAVLERDTRNGRAVLVERGFGLPQPQAPMVDWEATRSRWLKRIQLARQAAITAAVWLRWLLRGPLATAFRIARRAVVEGAICFLAACGVLAAFALAIIVLAPPV